ncbi:hypothetical protein [Streptococcus loxodontisalivarius]|uniref:Uncharacterized protein n=1 Tax=Streptococcus loxodontisalivarius TaxID=1349415 RepID=A0ABS2PQX0_9STRE|nr:hypothetical protein [Streptococcus loxodontisalivarius]MBM7642338.1 hypothetical protein [Streptococcus loxodontisalivarius]
MKKLFQASFEESLNLRDDTVSNGFIERNLAETEEKEKYRGTLKSYIWLTLLTIFFTFGPNWIFYKASYYIYSHFDSSFLKQSTYNFLPYWIFLLLGCTWLFLIIMGKRFSQKFILIYRGQFHLFVTYFLWLLIEWNLFCLTGFSASLGLFGTLSFLAINFYFIYIIFRNRIRNLLNLMFIKDERYKSDSSDKGQRVMLIIGIIFILWLVGKCKEAFISFECHYIFI